MKRLLAVVLVTGAFTGCLEQARNVEVGANSPRIAYQSSDGSVLASLGMNDEDMKSMDKFRVEVSCGIMNTANNAQVFEAKNKEIGSIVQIENKPFVKISSTKIKSGDFCRMDVMFADLVSAAQQYDFTSSPAITGLAYTSNVGKVEEVDVAGKKQLKLTLTQYLTYKKKGSSDPISFLNISTEQKDCAFLLDTSTSSPVCYADAVKKLGIGLGEIKMGASTIVGVTSIAPSSVAMNKLAVGDEIQKVTLKAMMVNHMDGNDIVKELVPKVTSALDIAKAIANEALVTQAPVKSLVLSVKRFGAAQLIDVELDIANIQ